VPPTTAAKRNGELSMTVRWRAHAATEIANRRLRTARSAATGASRHNSRRVRPVTVAGHDGAIFAKLAEHEAEHAIERS